MLVVKNTRTKLNRSREQDETQLIKYYEVLTFNIYLQVLQTQLKNQQLDSRSF